MPAAAAPSYTGLLTANWWAGQGCGRSLPLSQNFSPCTIATPALPLTPTTPYPPFAPSPFFCCQVKVGPIFYLPVGGLWRLTFSASRLVEPPLPGSQEPPVSRHIITFDANFHQVQYSQYISSVQVLHANLCSRRGPRLMAVPRRPASFSVCNSSLRRICFITAAAAAAVSATPAVRRATAALWCATQRASCFSSRCRST